jgi:PilZ domain
MGSDTVPTPTDTVPTPTMTRAQARAERRANVRVPIRVAVSLLVIGKKKYGWAVNISAGGVLVQCGETFPIGSRVEVDSLLALDESVHHLRAEGRVAHHYGEGMGIAFVDPAPESVRFIRRLVNRLLYPDRR